MVSRRKFCHIFLTAVTVGVSSPIRADSNTISKRTLKESNKKTLVVNISRKKYWEINLKGLDTSSVVIRGSDGQITLKEAIKRYKLGKATKILVAKDARDFPGISSQTVERIAKIPRDGFITVDTDVEGVCVNYTIGIGGIYCIPVSC